MKNQFSKLFLICFFIIGGLTVSGMTSACDSCNMHKHKHCKVIKGYWKHGVWHPARKVCHID